MKEVFSAYYEEKLPKHFLEEQAISFLPVKEISPKERRSG